ncbi:hypothetical protein [Nostoc punctiforme]|nr:hypothetical protein [Nostoc punctiforme]
MSKGGLGLRLDNTIIQLTLSIRVINFLTSDETDSTTRDFMAIRFILSDYVEIAIAFAIYDKLEDGTFTGRIPICKGAIAFALTLRECQDKLRSTLEDWILLGLKLGHSLPIID